MLMKELNITDPEVRRRLTAVDFGPLDLQRVTALQRIVVDHAQLYTDSFFAYLTALDAARGLMDNPQLLASARYLKREHLRAMVTGECGTDYVEERLKLGLI